MPKWLVMFAIAAIMTTGMSSEPNKGSAENENTRTTRPQSDSQNKDQDSPKAPSVVVQVSAPPVNISEANEEKEIQRKLAAYTLWLAIFTAVLAVVSIGQGYFLHTQADHLRTHGIELHALASAAKENAAAALLNAQAVIDAERAWITVTPHIGSPKFYPVREKNAPIPDDLVDVLPIAHLFAGKLVNVGKTPAKIEAAAIRYIRTPIHPSQWDANPDYGDIVENVLFAFPDEVNTISAELSPTATLTQAQIEAVQNQTEFLYAFGIVKYRDVYGNPHETCFGYLYQAQDRHLVMKDGVIETIRTGEARFRTGGPPKYNGHT
jgi:hypothetical protein